MALIELKNISFTYSDGTLALDNINVEIDMGKKISILGENGAGKSTLFLLLNGIYKSDKGEYYYKGDKIFKNKCKELYKKIGLVFQDPDVQLFAPTVFQEISFGLKNLGLDDYDVKDKVINTMKKFGITNLQDKPVHNLSYGQKKLVSIASIFAMETEVMIFDEPTTWLDVNHRNFTMKILNKIHSLNKTIIISTHDSELAYSWSDEIIILKNGKIAVKGNPEDIFSEEKKIDDLGIEVPFFIKLSQKLGLKKMPKSREELLNILEHEKCMHL